MNPAYTDARGRSAPPGEYEHYLANLPQGRVVTWDGSGRTAKIIHRGVGSVTVRTAGATKTIGERTFVSPRLETWSPGTVVRLASCKGD